HLTPVTLGRLAGRSGLTIQPGSRPRGGGGDGFAGVRRVGGQQAEPVRAHAGDHGAQLGVSLDLASISRLAMTLPLSCSAAPSKVTRAPRRPLPLAARQRGAAFWARSPGGGGARYDERSHRGTSTTEQLITHIPGDDLRRRGT